ncbi:MAG: cyclopropane fatty acyl phospholipid synthase [Desulfomonilaceae bacterium]|nr:cyclopropane fatty acyl phospholipid synthase [Desulfomonilaceae bacterium]
MVDHRSFVGDLLSQCGITINGSNPWDIHVHDDRFYTRVLRHKNLGLGEAYMDGWWDCDHVDEFICRILKANLDSRVVGSPKLLLRMLPSLLFNRQSKPRSRQVAERHYDVGNDLFMSFLDPYNQYSCAYFKGTDDLNRAQCNKLDLIAKKLELRPTDHVLDIGFGWGGLAKYIAEKYHCTVTGINISHEQISFAKEYCKDLPIRILHCDYRDVEDTFDKIVSVGMFEHVGRKNYAEFMRVAHRCLRDKGIFLLHTIGNNESQLDSDPWITKYIFPNGMLPGLAQISKAIEGLFVLEDLHNLGPHYDKTLMAWDRKFRKSWPALKNAYDERFKRMWEYYLLSCAGAFRARSIQLWQLVLTKYGTPQPTCRY